MDQDEDDKIEREGKTPRKKAHKDETKEERTARLRERKKSDTPSKDKVRSEMAFIFHYPISLVHQLFDTLYQFSGVECNQGLWYNACQVL